jgi:hypothetical protein
MMRPFNDPKLVPFIERSINTCVDPREVFDTAVSWCEEFWPITKGKVTTKRGERHNSHDINPEGIRTLMYEFKRRDLPDWYLLNLIEWCRDKSKDVTLSLLNYFDIVQTQYFKQKKIFNFALDDEEEIVLPKIDVTNFPHKKENEPGVIPSPRKKRRQVSSPAPRGFWSASTVAKLAGSTETLVMKALRSSQLVGEKRKGKWIVPKAAAKAWAEAFRLVAQ